MAVEPDFEIKRGATWPPLYLSVADADELLPLPDVLEIRVLLRKGSVLLDVDVEVLDPPVTDPDEPDGLPFNARHVWAEGETDVMGDYQVESVVTLGSGRVVKVPNHHGPIVRIGPALS